MKNRVLSVIYLACAACFLTFAYSESFGHGTAGTAWFAMFCIFFGLGMIFLFRKKKQI